MPCVCSARTGVPSEARLARSCHSQQSSNLERRNWVNLRAFSEVVLEMSDWRYYFGRFLPALAIR